MAKRDNGFDKSPERARLAGQKGGKTPKTTPDIKEAQALCEANFKEGIYKYLHMTVEELKAVAQNPKTTVMDHIIIKLLSISATQGDDKRIEYLLRRSIGPVPDKVEVKSDTTMRTVHDSIIDELKNG